MDSKLMGKGIALAIIIVFFAYALLLVNQHDLSTIQNMSVYQKVSYFTQDLDTSFSINLVISIVVIGSLVFAYECIVFLVNKLLLMFKSSNISGQKNV